MSAGGAQTRVLIKPTHPVGAGVWFELVDEDQPREDAGGWQDVARPRRQTAVEWIGGGAATYVLPLMLDGVETTPGRDASIEAQVRAVRSWIRPTKKTGEPPVLRIAGPLHFPETMRWVVDDITWGAKIRNNNTGRRVQQMLTISLKQYLEPTVVKSPAKKARNRNGHP